MDAYHRYTFNSTPMPGVTSVMKDLNLIETEWFTDEARERGRDVHDASLFLDEGTLDRGSLTRTVAGYLAGYERFLMDFRPDWTHMEAMLCDTSAWYAGTLDRAGAIKPYSFRGRLHRKAIIDLKTGDYSTAALQLAAYRRCIDDEPHAYLRIAIKLRPNGEYSAIPFTDPRDERRFISALDLWNFKNDRA